MTHLTIPASVTEIGPDAFNGCTGLQSVALPVHEHADELGHTVLGLTVLRRGTFAGCSSLAEVVLPASVREIHTFAFYSCTALVSITVPAGVSVVSEVSRSAR